LNDSQKAKFADLLWAKRNANGLSDDVIYDDVAFMWFPYSRDVNPDQLFRQYINQTEIFFDAYSKTTNGIPMTGGHSSYFSNIIGTYNTPLFIRPFRVCHFLIGRCKGRCKKRSFANHSIGSMPSGGDSSFTYITFTNNDGGSPLSLFLIRGFFILNTAYRI
jgi:hypothetical protein